MNNQEKEIDRRIMKARFKGIIDQEDLVKDEQRLLLDKKNLLIEEYSPIQVGDNVTIPETAYAHVGKKGKVTGIGLGKTSFNDEWEFTYFGKVYKKNNELSSSQAFKFRSKVEML